MSQAWRTEPDQTTGKAAQRRLRKRSRPARGSLALPAVVMSVLAAAFLVWFLIGSPLTWGSAPEVSASSPVRAPVQPPQIATAPFLAEPKIAPPAPIPEPAPLAPSVAPQPGSVAILPLELQPTRQITTPALMSAVVREPEQISAPAVAASPAADPAAVRRTPMAFAAPAPAPTPAPAPLSQPKPAPKAEPKPAAPQALAAAEPLAAADETDRPARSGFAIVLAQVETEGEARAKLGPLKQKFGALLGGRRLSYHRVKDGGAYVWRVRSAGMNEDEAADLCEKIESAGGDCSAVAQ